MENRVEYFEPCWAAQRSGLFFTCINSHFNADEVAYILDDCDAQVLVVSDTLRDVAAELVDKMPRVKIRLDGRRSGQPRRRATSRTPPTRDRYPAEPLDEELEGTRMLYSSGTTGRPKGVKYKITRQRVGDLPVEMGMMTAVWGMDGDAVYLSPAPLYHSAPLFYSMSTMRLGGTVIMMEHFDPEETLALHREVPRHARQFVPTMFVRMLKLPDEVRNRYDLSSLKVVLHAAAPCSVETKRKMIEWWGPIIDEYYAATEGTGATYINSRRLARAPGLGRPLDARPDPHPRRRRQRASRPARSAPSGSSRRPTGPASSTTRTRRRRATRSTTRAGRPSATWATSTPTATSILTDRRTFMIVSGGVNIYPQEAENLLIDHPKVYDVAVFGIPDPEMGERVHAVVQPTDWDDAGPELEQELLAYCREHLAHYKCPQAVDFDRELPREQTGKLYKRLLRDRYWGDKTSRIV